MLLALVSVVPVAWALQVGPDVSVIEQVGWHPLGTGQAVVLALGSVAPAGVLGGALGGFVWRRRRTLAPVAALSTAWVTGILALPIVAAAADIPLRAGIGCIDACIAHLRNDQPTGGAGAYGELLMTVPFTIPFLVVPFVLLVLARRLDRPALWSATWLAVHAVLNMYGILGDALRVYLTLLLGIIAWAAWLWARDARHPAFRTPVRRWAVAIGPAALAIGVTWGSASGAWIPDVPEQVQGTLVGTARLHGFNPPDPSDWMPPILVPRTPDGRGCFDSVDGPAGRLDLCWDGYRDNRERLPGGDIYHFRLSATLHSTGPTSWVAITIRVPDDGRTYVRQIWPRGVLDGPCRTAAVDGMNFLTDGDMTSDVAQDLACGRTTAARSDHWLRHQVIWTCAACGSDAASGRQIAFREIVGTAEGSVPTWEVYAELGP